MDVKELVQKLYRSIAWELHKLRPLNRARLAEHVRFDEKFGVDTWSDMHSPEYLAKHFSENKNYLYEPCEPWLFKEIIKQVVEFGVGRDWTFIDVGSGKGRVLMLAAPYFNEVIGIEIDESLHKVAIDNFTKLKGSSVREHQIMSEGVTLHNCDIQNYKFTDNNLFLTLFNPFSDKLMIHMLDCLDSDVHHGNVVIGYVNPIHKQVFSGRYSELFFSTRYCIYKRNSLK